MVSTKSWAWFWPPIRALCTAAAVACTFNCRPVTGNRYRISQHSYGNAIDINTFENPYVTWSRDYPAAAEYPYYRFRAQNLDDHGVISTYSVVAQTFKAFGWVWGGRWSPPDYQHFSSNGG